MNWLESLSKEMKILVGAIACLVTFGGFLFGAHNYMEKYALAEELKQTNQRLDYKIIGDQLNSVQQRIWLLEDRHGKNPTDKTIAEELRNLQEQKKALSEDLGKYKK